MGSGWVGIPVGSSLKGKLLLFPAIFFTKWLNKKNSTCILIVGAWRSYTNCEGSYFLTVTSVRVFWLFLTCLGDRLNSSVEYSRRVTGPCQREDLTWSLKSESHTSALLLPIFLGCSDWGWWGVYCLRQILAFALLYTPVWAWESLESYVSVEYPKIIRLTPLNGAQFENGRNKCQNPKSIEPQMLVRIRCSVSCAVLYAV